MSPAYSLVSADRAGFTRPQFFVLVIVVGLLVAVSMGPVMSHLKAVRLSRAVSDAKTLGTLLSQYATDNDGVYPVGEGTPAVGKSEGIARNFLANNYVPDPGIFALNHAVKYEGKEPDFSDFTSENISWDFTAGANATTGITSSAPDSLPVVYTTGETVPYPTAPAVGLDLVLSGQGPFGNEGVVVAYKANNAVFIPSVLNGNIAICHGFISAAYKDTYTQIKP
jgi:type II secretory pathway pseudopilin PulG